MRKSSIVALALGASFFAGPALAEEGVEGFISIAGGYGWENVQTPKSDEDGSGWAGELRATIARSFPNNWGFQVDGVYYHQLSNFDVVGSAFTENVADAALHVFRELGGKTRVGALFQYRYDHFTISSGGGDDTTSFSQIFAGGEAQWMWGKWAFTGQAGYAGLHASSGSANGWFGTLKVGTFVNPNWYVGINGGYSHMTEQGDRLNVWEIGAETDYRIGVTPLIGLVRLTHSQSDFPDEGFGGTNNVVLAGVKWSLDRGGPSPGDFYLDPVGLGLHIP
jgi:hypothetical protein